MPKRLRVGGRQWEEEEERSKLEKIKWERGEEGDLKGGGEESVIKRKVRMM